MRVTFPGGKKVQAAYRGFTIQTDQPQAAGGEGTAPTPFDLFLASIGTCMGYYVLAFCQQRGIPTEEVELALNVVRNEPEHRVERVEVAVSLPADFPERYVDACIKAAQQCTVKRHLHEPPMIVVEARRAVS